MNTEQIRHAKSVAKHLQNHISHLQSVVAGIECSSNGLLANVPANQCADTFRDEVVGCIKGMNSVIMDMLPGLEEEVKC